MQVGSFLYSASDSKLREKYIQAKAKKFHRWRQHIFAQKKQKKCAVFIQYLQKLVLKKVGIKKPFDAPYFSIWKSFFDLKKKLLI